MTKASVEQKLLERGKNMPTIHGRQLSRNRSLDGTIIKRESDVQIQEGTKLHELGQKFEADKEKLEQEIEKIEHSSLSNAEKRTMLTELKNALIALKQQYNKEVTIEQARVQAEQKEKIESMEEAADELARQAEDLRSVQMEAASADTSAAADAADAQKAVFDDMKEKAVQKLQLQMEQAAAQQRRIHAQRLSGR